MLVFPTLKQVMACQGDLLVGLAISCLMAYIKELLHTARLVTASLIEICDMSPQLKLWIIHMTHTFIYCNNLINTDLWHQFLSFKTRYII